MKDATGPKLIRLYCDGELMPEQAERVEQGLKEGREARDRLEFEKELRRQVGAVMAPGSAPPGLAERVRRQLAEVAPEEAFERRFSIASWFRGPTHANIFAVAASLAVVAGAVLFGIFGRTIDEWGRGADIDLVAEAVPYV